MKGKSQQIEKRYTNESSGVSVQPNCATVFEQVKLGHKFRYIIYALTPNLKEIYVLKTAPPEKTYDDFVAELEEAETLKECRYGVFDAEFYLSDGQKRTKLLFFFWSPDTAKIKQKMVYSSSKDYLKNALVGVSKHIQANDAGDLAWGSILEMLLKAEAAS